MIVLLTAHMGAPDAETARRMAVARLSFEQEMERAGQWIAPVLTFTRDSTMIGDPAPVPFVNDLLDQGIDAAQSDADILLLVNADCSIAPGFTDRLKLAVELAGAVYMRRREFARIDAPFASRQEIKAGGVYVGGDGFAFTVGWWREHGQIFPDFVMGRGFWDSGLKNLIRRAHGAEMWAELAHETHENPPWHGLEKGERHDDRYSQLWKIAGNAHNKALLDCWISLYGGSENDHLFSYAELAFK